MKGKIVVMILLVFSVLLLFGCSNEAAEIPVEKEEVQKDSGTYVGLIDNNSIEIKISGVPEEKSARAFQLTDKIKDNFEQFGLQPGDQVHFSFYKNNDGQLVLTSIEKIQN